MLLRVTVAFLGSLLLLFAGCQKDQDKKADESAQSKAPAAGETLASKEAGDEAAPVANLSEGFDKKAGITPEQTQQVREAVLQAAKNMGLQFDEENKLLRGKGLPELGVSVEKLVDSTKRLLVEMHSDFEQNHINKAALSVVAAEMPPPKGVDIPERPKEQGSESDKYRKSKDQNAQQADSSAGKQQIDKSELEHAKQIIGDWKSIKEIHSRFTAQHNSDYYEFVNISNDGKMLMKVYRKGEAVSDREFGYSYNAKTGEVLLRDDSGNVVNSMVAYNKGDDESHLYLEYKSGTIKVYTRLSKVGVPLTEEEKKKLGEKGGK